MKYKNILIFHESNAERNILKKYTESSTNKIIVKEAHSTSEIELLTANQHFDIIISNVIIPNYDAVIKSGTKVIIIIPDKSEEQLTYLKKHGIINYQVFPQNKAELQDKINSICNYGIYGKQPEVDVTGTKAIFHLVSKDIEGHVLKASEGELLCEIEVEEDYEYIFNDICMSIEFPHKLGNTTIKKIGCNFLMIQKAEKQDGKTRIEFIVLITKIEKKQKQALRKVFRIVNNLQNPPIQWVNRNLEINTNQRTITYFSITQLMRIAIVFLIVIAGLGYWLFTTTDAPGQKVKILWRNGTVFFRAAENKVWEIATKEQYPAAYYFKIENSKTNSKILVTDTPDAKIDATAVFRYDANETVLLSKNGTLHREINDNIVHYFQFTGAAHLLIDPNQENKPQHFNINGLNFLSETFHLFYQNISQPAEITVAKGQLTVPPQQDLFLSISETIKPESDVITISATDVIKINNSKIIQIEKKAGDNKQFEETYLPGFTGTGLFQQIGYAKLEQNHYLLLRHGKMYEVGVNLIPIMLKDIIKGGKDGKAVLKTYNRDLVRVYPNSELTLDQYPLPDHYPLLPFSTNVKIQDAQKLIPANLDFKGKIRVRINSKVKNRVVRLKSAESIVGVIGTEFETTSQTDFAEVLTVTGDVKFSDTKDKNQVEVGRGMMSEITSNNSPTASYKIPKPRLIALLNDSFEKHSVLQLSVYDDTDLSAVSLSVNSAVTLYWNANLINAEIIIDGRKISLDLDLNSPELVLSWETFSMIKPGKYHAKIIVTNHLGRPASLDINLFIEAKVKISKNKLEFDGEILFKKGKAVIKPESFAILNDIIIMLQQHPKLDHISIEGHTDSDGTSRYNLNLSGSRAQAVKKHLTDRGIAKNRLSAKGFGHRKPIADNNTAEGKQKNRRVEFIVK